jgi:CBS domain-containing protein
MIKVESVMAAARARLAAIGIEDRLIAAASLLTAPEYNLVVVRDERGRLAGVITKTDVVAQISRCEGSSCNTSARNIMVREAITCHPGDWLEDVWRIFSERQLKNIPVVDANGAPLGVLNVKDALQALLEDVQYEEKLLRDYVMGVGYH